jgi:hypothetical protein
MVTIAASLLTFLSYRLDQKQKEMVGGEKGLDVIQIEKKY